jgi:plasmid stabilization system protein ParE
MVPEIGRPDIRELLAPPYRIFYRLRPGSCQVLTIRHARQHTTSDNFDS